METLPKRRTESIGDRLVEQMPTWIPAEQDGRKVSVYYTLRAIFNLQR